MTERHSRPSRRAWWFGVLFLVALVALACGGNDDDPGSGDGPVATATPRATPTLEPAPAFNYPTGADDVVLLVDVRGGSPAQSTPVLDLPWIVVYGDGRVITQGPIIAIYPPPALPNLQEGRISPDGIQAILRAADDAGLTAGDAEYTSIQREDAQTTIFVVNADGTPATVTVTDLEQVDLPPEVPEEEATARAALRVFRQQVVDYQSLVPAGAIEQEQEPFEITRLQVVVVPAESALIAPDPSVDPGVMPWPFDIPPAEFGEPIDIPNARCAMVEGDALADLLETLGSANQLTQWESGEARYALYPRPLLPHEEPCVFPAQ